MAAAPTARKAPVPPHVASPDLCTKSSTSPEAARIPCTTSSVVPLRKGSRDGRGPHCSPSALCCCTGLLPSAGKECTLGQCPRDLVLEEGLAHHRPPDHRVIRKPAPLPPSDRCWRWHSVLDWSQLVIDGEWGIIES